jgi:hypothetical protein
MLYLPYRGYEHFATLPRKAGNVAIFESVSVLFSCMRTHHAKKMLKKIDPVKRISENLKIQKTVPTVSAVLDSGTLLEMVYLPESRRTAFIIFQNGAWREETSFPLDPLHRLVPYAATNNLIANQVVLLPSAPEEYGSEEALLAEIQGFIHRYVDISPLFEKIASYYVLFSWVHDSFNELPYLRLRGDYGSGKTRALLTLGSLCYKPIFASGASTVSPIFRILDAFKGTLIIDEGDFRFSDEKTEIVKILNNGNVKGFPVLRSEVSDKKEFNPRAYHVFGPKLVATRGFFDDRALESRFLTEEMGTRQLRENIPINLPASFHEEALNIRNKLLLFRFLNWGKRAASEALVDRSIEPRLNQIFVPLLSIIEDAQAREELREVARAYHREIMTERGMDTEAQMLEIIRDLTAASDNPRLSIREIAAWFIDRYGDEYERKITNKWIGYIIRKRLNLKTQKSDGIFVIPLLEEQAKLDRLYQKYGLSPKEEAIQRDAGAPAPYDLLFPPTDEVPEVPKVPGEAEKPDFKSNFGEGR